MGVIVRYTCKNCDFVADNVLLGPGWTTYQEPVLCEDCGSVFSRPLDEKQGTILEKYSQCTICDSNNIVKWNHTCPKCGSTAIDEEAAGMWD